MMVNNNAPKCGICGNTKNLVKTECCGKWICDLDAMTSGGRRKPCYEKHSRFTLCGFHFNEGHFGRWQECEECRNEFETEMYVYYGTNKYNFEKLENPPQFEPTKCHACGKIISLSEDSFSRDGGEYYCQECGAERFHRKTLIK